MINIVVFNGGRGSRTMLAEFLDMDEVYYTSIVNAYDDGKSTGILRSFFGMLGPSDIRKVQELMLPPDMEDFTAVTGLFNFRYPEKPDRKTILKELKDFSTGQSSLLAGYQIDDASVREPIRVLLKCVIEGINLIEKAEGKEINLSDCSLMNLIYAGAFLYCDGNFEDATILIDKLFKLRGTVLPTNNEDKKLVAIREDGTVLFSEAEIVELRSNSRIKKIFLLDKYPQKDIVGAMKAEDAEQYLAIMNREVTATSRVKRTIRDADIIIYSPGTQHSSLYPSYITRGVTESIAANRKALKVFITNIGEDYETPSYAASDYINGALRYLRSGKNSFIAPEDLISIALVNNTYSNKSLENYVQFDEDELGQIKCEIIPGSFEDAANPGKHDGKKIARYIIGEYYKRLANIN